MATSTEIDFVLEHIRHYLSIDPSYTDIKSVFCGLRPLVKGGDKSTAALSRDHHINISESGMITITGGKWTIYRRMAEDTINMAVQIFHLPAEKSQTTHLHLHGYMEDVDFELPFYYYGSDGDQILNMVNENPSLSERIHANFPNIIAEVHWAVKEEMCMTIEDFLARRTRMLFLDAKASVEASETVANIMAGLLGKDENWTTSQVKDYTLLANSYLPNLNPGTA